MPSTYNELCGHGCSEGIGNLSGILADACFARPYRPEGLGDALLAPVYMRRPIGLWVCLSPFLISARLPPGLDGKRVAVLLGWMVRAGGARRADAEGLLFLVRREKVGLESGEFERRMRV